MFWKGVLFRWVRKTDNMVIDGLHTVVSFWCGKCEVYVLWLVIGLKKHLPLFIQLEVKPKPIKTCIFLTLLSMQCFFEFYRPNIILGVRYELSICDKLVILLQIIHLPGHLVAI